MQVNKKYSEVKNLIEEADLILFKGNGIVSPLLRMVGRSEYTHVGIASWKYTRGKDGLCYPDVLECIEYKEFRGARTTNMDIQVNNHSGRIDVFRPSRQIQVFNEKNLSGEWIYLDPFSVTNIIRIEAGMPYGWDDIFKIAITYIPFSRLIFKTDMNDDTSDDESRVCSGSISRAYRLGYCDPVKFLADDYTQPGDLARSVMFSYLFTLEYDK